MRYLLIILFLASGILQAQTTFLAKDESGALLQKMEVSIGKKYIAQTNENGKIELDIFKGDTVFFISDEKCGEYIATEDDPKTLQEITCINVMDVIYAPLGIDKPAQYKQVTLQPGYDLRKWFAQHLTYPQSAIDECRQGKCFARFEVEPDGSITHVTVRKGVPFAPQCDSVVVNMLKSMPNWPARESYEKTKQIFMVCIRFVLEGNCGPSVIFYLKTGSDHYKLDVYRNRQHAGRTRDGSFSMDLAIGDTITFVSHKWYYRYIATKVQVTEHLSCLRKADAVILKPEFPEGSFTPPDVFPKFAGGNRGLKKWLKTNIRETPNTEKCSFYVRFTIEADGKASNYELVESSYACFVCEQEVLRLLDTMINWSPALKDGQPVRSFYTIQIGFKTSKKDYLKGPIPKPEVAPRFPGGKIAMNKWVRSHMKLAKKGKRHKMVLRCTIETDGSISNVDIADFFPEPAVYCLYNLELCKSMPKWIPARDAAGNPVRAYGIVTVRCTEAVERKLTPAQIRMHYR